MADFQSSQTAEQIETVLVGAITPTRGRTLTEAEKQVARDYIGATAFGDGIKVLAHFDTYDELVSAVTKPAAGDSYSVGEQLPYRRYAYDFYHNEWRDYGPIRSEDISARLATNLLVLADEWIADNTVFENYTFRASLPLGEITGNDFASVVFAPADAAGGNFCPVAFAFDGYVEIWANSRPEKETIVKSVTFITITDGGEGNNTAGITNATGVVILRENAVSTANIADGSVSFPKLEKSAKTLAWENITILDSAWEESTDFQGYPWRAAITLPDSGVNATYKPQVNFDEASREGADLSEDCISYDGGVYIYAASPPEILVFVENITCEPTLVETLASSVFASIAVTYAAGNALTCTDGTTTLTAKSTSGRWTFAIPYAGTWTVTDGEYEQSVSITTQGQNVHVVLGRTWDGVLYDAGDEWTEITGGWEQNTQNTCINAALSGNVTFNADNIYINAPASKAAGINTKKKVDITGYSVLYFDITVETQNNDSYGLVATIPTDIFYDAVAKINSTSTGRMTLSVDLSDVTDGEYYVVVGATAGTVARNRTVHKIWLE